MPELNEFLNWAKRFPEWTRVYIDDAIFQRMVEALYVNQRVTLSTIANGWPERLCIRVRTVTVLPKSRWRHA